ncbi:MAG: vitamin K epoxide reductase family protein [bacterium]|nr:vitamin K epoxide reductase family protein [bacterium]
MFTKPLAGVVAAMLVAVIVGFIDSGFLFYKYITASSIDCLLFDGCNTVAKSPYSNIFGIPLPLFGIIFYSLMFLSVFFFAFRKTVFLGGILLALGIVGFAFSLYFIFLQGFIIQAFCIYCLLSAFTSTVLLCSAIYAYQSVKVLNDVDVSGV